MSSLTRFRHAGVLLLILGVLVSCQRGPRPLPAELHTELQTWRQDRLTRLTSENGWLTLIGLHWLEPGEHSFGSADTCEVVLPDPTIPPVAGTVTLEEDGKVILKVAEKGAVTVNGLDIASTRLTDDSSGRADRVQTGRITFYVIRRADRLGLRIKDPDAPTRKTFKGLEYFPEDARYRVVARLERYAHPRAMTIDTAIGTQEEMLSPGVLRFQLIGHDLSLAPLVQNPDDHDFFIVFRDATSGVTSYSGGRFLEAELEQNDTAVLDFNRAYSPPCAFTPFATCPLPPEENVLTVPIEAGEKVTPGAHPHHEAG